MSLQIGIVGLPNVGKSTLFKALTKKQVESANYPFTTIEPNVGVVAVPDQRLEALSKLSASEKTIHTIVEFVDIAGLVRGAHKGEGLGNQFLSHIREVAAIAEVVRVFPDKDVTHVHGKLDPADDIDAINAELALADLETVTKRLTAIERLAKSGDKEALIEQSALTKIKNALDQGQPARSVTLEKEERPTVHSLNLLSSKPIIYIVNMSEEQYKDNDEKEKLLTSLGLERNEIAVPISAKIESELVDLSDEDREIFLKELEIKQSGLDDVIQAAYKKLGLITFLTSGPKESKAWAIKKGSLAPQAAGAIHTDFEKGFIKAETIYWQDLIKAGSLPAAREKGLVRTEGKDYSVKDGDVMEFRFSPA